MRGRFKADVLPLTVNTRLLKIIEKQITNGSIPQRLHRRLLIIQNGIRGKIVSHTSRDLNTSRPTIRRWQNRWRESVNDLIEASQNQELQDYEIFQLISEILTDLQRPGTPEQITFEQKEQIRALACTNPIDHGIEMTVWTHEMLAHVAMAKNVVDTISSRYVGTILKKTK